MKNKKTPLIMAIFLLSVLPFTARAIVDTNYVPLDLAAGEVVAESATSTQPEVQTMVAPASQPADPVVVPVQAPPPPPAPVSAPSGGKVLGVAKERDPLEKAYKLLEGKFNELFENYGQLQIEMAQLKASAEKTQERNIMERSNQNIVYVIFAVVLASIMLFIEIEYTKFLPRLIQSDKTGKKKKAKQNRKKIRRK